MIKEAIAYFKRALTKPEGLKLTDTGPVSRYFGLDRGTPIDRYYMDKFLTENKHLIKGAVLEIEESTYTQKYGTGVTAAEILFTTNDHPHATIIGDLTQPATLPENRIDCFICTQTYNFIYDVKAAIAGTHRLLKPGGVVLATVSGISQISTYDMERWGDYWRFTTLSAKKLFEEVFGTANVEVNFWGNCLAATSYLRGIASEELSPEKLDLKDPEYQMTITIVAKKNN